MDQGSQEVQSAAVPRMTESAPSRETRQQRAARRVSEAEEILRGLDRQLDLGRAFAADRSNPLRERMAARLGNGMTRVARAGPRASIRLRRPELAEEPTFSERMFSESREHFRLAEESRRSGRGRIAESPVAVRRSALNATIEFAVGWMILGAVIAADYVVFRALDIQYFRWYLENGALINLAFGFVSLAVVLDAYRDLISSNPLRYLLACTALFMHALLAWDATTVKDDAKAEQTWWVPTVFDNLVSIVVYVVMFLITLAWLLVVAPVQHIVYAVLGAPARNAIRNEETSSYDPVTDKTTLFGRADEAAAGFTIGYRDKPVTLTAALAAAAFWLISVLS
jgi:hypothetical protein